MRSAARALYAGAMNVGAAVAYVVAQLPGAPPRWRAVGDRLARLDPATRAAAAGAPALWVHAASVGEVRAVRPLLVQLRARFPGRQLLVTTLTRTGLAQAREFPEAHAALLLPLDAPWVVRRIVGAFRLEGFLFTETEIWPVLLGALAAAGVPAIMVSGRVSERTVARAGLARRLYRDALGGVTCCMQSEADAARILRLGADPRRVHVTGSLKEASVPEPLPPAVETLTRLLADPPRRVIVAGSTHAGEDEALLALLGSVATSRRDVVLLLAPRHPERFEPVAATIAATGTPLVRFTAIADGRIAALPSGPLVVLLDAVGPLVHCYPLATIAFVGGTLVPVGGHNVLEPARAGRAIVVGPHTANAADAVERLATGGGLVRVASAEALGPVVGRALDDPVWAAEMGARARALAGQGQGALERHMKIVATRLSAGTFARAREP